MALVKCSNYFNQITINQLAKLLRVVVNIKQHVEPKFKTRYKNRIR